LHNLAETSLSVASMKIGPENLALFAARMDAFETRIPILETNHQTLYTFVGESEWVGHRFVTIGNINNAAAILWWWLHHEQLGSKATGTSFVNFYQKRQKSAATTGMSCAKAW
jgi:hypothetical protein